MKISLLPDRNVLFQIRLFMHGHTLVKFNMAMVIIAIAMETQP